MSAQKNPLHRISETTIQAAEFHGPIPSPDHLRQYEQILPGSAERLITSFERQSAHRQDLERQAVAAQIADSRQQRSESRLGQILGFAIGIAALVCGTIVACYGQPWAGSVIGGVPVVGLVTAFIMGRKAGGDTES